MPPSWEEMSRQEVAYARLTPEGRFLQVNQATCRLFGYSEEVMLGLTARDLTHPEDRAQSVALVDRAIRQRQGSHQVIKRYLHKEGHILWTFLSTILERDAAGQPIGFLSRMIDISDQMESDRVLRLFVRRLQTIKEQERQAIARDLHQELGQTFASLKMELDTLQSMLPPEARAQAVRLSTVVDDTLGSVRRFTAALRPPILDELGLESALDWLLGRVCERAGLAWSFPHSDKPLLLDWETRIALFRIAQEGLKYVVRHSEASLLEVSLEQDGDWVVLCLIDDGRGSPPTPDLAHGLEIYIMRERAAVLGGSVTLRQRDPMGTVVEVRLPAPLQANGGRRIPDYWESSLSGDSRTEI